MLNFRKYLVCPITSEDWKQIEEKFRSRWNVSHALGPLDRKLFALKKPKKSGSEILQLQGLLFPGQLALVNTDYRFLWVDVGSSGSSSDAQIINCSKLKKNTENGTWGLPASEPLGEGGPDLHYFLLGDNSFALMPSINQSVFQVLNFRIYKF